MEDLPQSDLFKGEPEVPLHWKDEYLEKPISRNVTANGPQEVPLTKERFSEFLSHILNTAGYFECATIHGIRRGLGKKVEDKSHGQ